MFQIIYISQTAERLSEEELSVILGAARANNASMQVTGMLLYAGNTFLQVLEGARPVVESIYDKIFMDDRHARVKLLSAREVPQREFSDWSMGFRRLEEREVTSKAFFELSKGTLPDMIPPKVSQDTIKYLRGFSDVKIQAA